MAGKRKAEKGKKAKKRKIKKSSLQEMEERAKLSWSPRTNVIEDIIQVSKNTLKNFREEYPVNLFFERSQYNSTVPE